MCSPDRGLYCCCCYYYYYYILLFCNLITTTTEQQLFLLQWLWKSGYLQIFQFSSRGARVNGSECHVHVLLMSGTCAIFHLLVEVHYLEVLKKCHAAILPYL